MGNQLVGIAPSSIYPVEHYLIGSFESDLQYESSMGSTRFFKVARAKSDEGLVVVKVFVKHDPSLPLEVHAERLEYIKKNLSNAVNCLPFQRVVLTEKAGLIMREYVKHSLYDKLSTRPFLTVLEKKWITFQLLCALNQCHKHKICHGDIKLENILITSWNWLLLSDFASFKPVYLPEDNPADYTYFFDTSRRRTCYIAPERFVKSFTSDVNAQAHPHPPSGNTFMIDSIVGDGPYYTGHLLPEMDIFSAGCALLELWSDGNAPFEFPQLLAYRAGEMDLIAKHLKAIENERLQKLLTSMIHRNPKERKSAELYLDQERGKLFPEYFYSFLQSYLQMFSSIPILPVDDKIMRLRTDISHIIEMLSTPENNDKLTNNENNGLIIITSVVTSCIRGLHYCNTKISCLEILYQLAENTTSETILDRILTYILYLTNDAAPRVRVAALDTMTACLCLIKNLPRSDINIFPEYLLPTIGNLAVDNAVVVRVAYAKNIATLAEIAVHFLEQTQLNNPSEMPTQRYESELNALHDMLQLTVSSLLTDSQAIVKQTLIESGITKLCVFFGRQKANDLILSHMITFLNDKEDKCLRGSFYDCIVGVAAFVGWQCSDILLPLLQQGLTDLEEFVIAKSIRATTALTELGLIQKTGLTEFITECACYLNHPNLWIRHEMCGLISTAAKSFGAIDVQCKIMPAISNHLRTPLIQVEKPEMLLDCLHAPIPRNIFDSIVTFPDIEQLMLVLEERKKVRAIVVEGVLPQYGEMSNAIRNLFRRLANDSLNDFIELQILSLKPFLIKLNKYKAAENKKIIDGKIILDKRKSADICREYVLAERNIRFETTRKSNKEKDVSEWHHMFGGVVGTGGVIIANTGPTGVLSSGHSGSSGTIGIIDQTTNASTPSSDSCTSATLTDTTSLAVHIQATPSSSLVEYSMPERSFLQERTSECYMELEKLQSNVKNRYQILSSTRDFETVTHQLALPANWRMKGILVAHLHEHSASVSRMALLKQNGSFFASASIDGSVRLWDCNKLDGRQSINRSRQAYSANTPIYSITACDAGQSLAIAGKDGSLLLLRIDPNSSKMALQHARAIVDEDGPVIDMQTLDQGSQSVIIYATLYGGIICWDLRTPNTNAWRLQSPLKHGLITTFCIDPTNSWLATGTSSGRHICWDLRFRLPIAEIIHPYEARIRKVIPHPTEPSWLISTSHSNNEVAIWNIETGHRQAALWASNNPPLSKDSNKHCVNGIICGTVERSPFIITGSSDQRIRYWDLSTPKNSSLIVPNAKDNIENNFTYDSRLIDGTHVTYENQQNMSMSSLSTTTKTTMTAAGSITAAAAAAASTGQMITQPPFNTSGMSTASNVTTIMAAAATTTTTSGLNPLRNLEDLKPRSGPELPSPGHHDIITDLLLLKTQKYTFIASSSGDGVIKLWK